MYNPHQAPDPKATWKKVECPDECFDQEGHGYNCPNWKCKYRGF